MPSFMRHYSVQENIGLTAQLLGEKIIVSYSELYITYTYELRIWEDFSTLFLLLLGINIFFCWVYLPLQISIAVDVEFM